MKLFRRWALWPYFFYWTVASRATRFAWRDSPGEHECRLVSEPGHDLRVVATAVKTVLDEKGATASQETRRTASTAGKDDDFSNVLAPLRQLMRHYDDDGRYSRSALVAIARILVDVSSVTKDATTGSEPLKLSFFEAEMIDVYEARIDRVCESWQQRKNALEARAKQAKHALVEALTEYRALIERHRAKQFREPQRTLSLRAYWPVMLLLGVVEYPLNAVAFRVLREKDWLTYMLAALPAIVIVLLAHLLGTKWKQWPDKPMTRYIILTAVAAGALVLGLVAIAVLRAEFIVAGGRSVDLLQGGALLAVNLLVLAGGIVAAYHAHDESAEVEGICLAKSRIRKKLERLWRVWSDAASKFDAERGSAIEQVNRLRDDARASIDEFRAWNALHRDDRSKTPASFKGDVTDRLFRPRDFGGELDLPPDTLDEILALEKKAVSEAFAWQLAASTTAVSGVPAASRTTAAVDQEPTLKDRTEEHA